MKRAMFVVVSLVIVLTWCTGVWAQEKTPPVAYAYRASEPISVDGDIAEWITLTPIVINDISQVIRDADHWLGPDGTSCVVYVMWDEDNLYLAADVTTTSRFDVIDGLPLDYVDNFMVYISTDPDLDPGRTAYDTRDFLLYLITDNNWWDTAFDRSMVEKRERFSSAGMEGGENVLEGLREGCSADFSWFHLRSGHTMGQFLQQPDTRLYTSNRGCHQVQLRHNRHHHGLPWYRVCTTARLDRRSADQYKSELVGRSGVC